MKPDEAPGPSASALAGLPFDAQLRAIDQWILSVFDERGLRALLDALEPETDPTPLAYVTRALLLRGAPAPARVASLALAQAARMGDAALLPVAEALRALAPRLTQGAREAVAEALALEAHGLPMERSEAHALLVQTLVRVDPEVHARHCGRARSAVEASVGGSCSALDAPDALDDRVLRALRGSDRAALDALWGFRARYERFGRALIAHLGRAPRTLAQASAQALLSRKLYTDPSHFLAELLQNADDAGAVRFALRVADDEGALLASHDGAPFDARDVVGVLSVGLSTKGEGQIGTFGVGFKSVYQVSDRPRVHAPPFHFELAAPSLPRALDPAHAPRVPEQTAIVLPLRGDAPERSRVAREVLAAALALPSEVLLTLAHVRALEVRRGSTVVRALRCVSSENSASTVTLASTNEAGVEGLRAFRVATRGEVRVAVALDPQGAPRALGDDDPALFAWLPTRERTGLRMLVHAPFALRVDRERVDFSVARNAALLSEAARALAEVLARSAPAHPAAVRALVPVEAELPAAVRFVAAVFDTALRSVPLFPGADGALHAAPALAMLPHPALADALRSTPLAAHRLLPAGRMADPRDERLCVRLGARTVTAAEVSSLLASIAPADWPVALDRALALAVRDGALANALEGLREVSLLPTLRGGDRVAPARAVRGPEPLASLYASARPVVAPIGSVEPELYEGYCRALRVRVLTVEALARDLSDVELRPRLLERAGPHGARLWSALASAPPASLLALAAQPVVADEHDAWAAPSELALVRDPALAALLQGWSGPRPACVHTALAREHGALLASLGARSLDLVSFACDFALAQGSNPDAADLARLHTALADTVDELAPRALERLASAPIFSDTRGVLRPLRAASNALAPVVLPAHEALEALVPEAPWLARPLRDAAHVRAARPEVLDDDALVAALTATPHPALASLPPRAALAYLAARSAALSPATRAALAAAPVWPTRDGRTLPLGTWDHPSPHAAHPPGAPGALLDALERAAYPLLSLRDDDPLEALLAALASYARAPAVRDLVRALRAGAFAHAAHSLDDARAIRRAIIAHPGALRALTADEQRALCDAPLWPSSAGSLERAASLLRPAEARAALGPELADALLALRVPTLDPTVEPDAQPLASVTPFAPPLVAFASLVRAVAVAEAPLASQPALLSTPARVARALEALGPESEGLPLFVTLDAKLTAHRVRALDDADALVLVEALGLASRVAHPAFRAALSRESALRFTPPFDAVRVLRAVASDRSAPAAFARAEVRSAFYRWLAREGPALAELSEPRAWLARAELFVDATGVLRAPTALSFDPPPPELGLPDAGPHAELPSELARWLGDTFVTEGARLEALVTRLLEAHEGALATGDGPRADLALAHLARALRDPARQVPALPRGLKLHRRLRVLDASGARRRPRDLLLPLDEHRALLSAFLPATPPFLSDSYVRDPALCALLAACETPRVLGPEALVASLDDPTLGLEARVALARYIAARALETPALRSDLRLDDRPWLPDRTGTSRAPRALFWPDPRLEARTPPPAPSELLHPQLAVTLPEALGAWLHFRRAGEPARAPSSAISLAETRASSPVLAPPEPAAPPAPWHRRVRDWLRAPPADEANSPPPSASLSPSPSPPAAPPTALSPTRDDRSFEPSQRVSSQLRDASAWLANRARPPVFSLAHAPRELAYPYLYAPHTLAERFDPHTQQWTPERADPEWLRGDGTTHARVAFRGSLPPGPSLLPLPFYASLSVSDARFPGKLDRDRHGRPLLFVGDETHESPVFFHAVLDRAPRFDEDARAFSPAHAARVAASLTAHTAPDDELPDEVHAFVSALRAADLPLLRRALEARDFVRARYRYDPTYLEDPAVARWLAGLTEGRAHAHLAALHASRDATHLGGGVCFELNALLCELLRRVSVPAAVCTGWVLDAGEVSDPDHLWAVALLPSPQGPRWLPLDASVTSEGRPLRVARRPRSSHNASPPTPPMPSGGMPAVPSWARTPARGAPGARGATAGPPGSSLRETRGAPPLAELVRVTRWLEALAEESPVESSRIHRVLEALRADPGLARGLLRALLGEPDGRG